MSLHSPSQRSTPSSRSHSRASNPFWSHSARQSNDNLESNAASDFQNPLQQFFTFVNEDVEMQAPLVESSYFIVPDTNILLHYLDALAAFAKDVQEHKLPVMIVIPTAVVNELDWQKKDIWFSRKASLWLWTKIQEKQILKGQARNEHMRNHQECYSNDERILDCALYFAQIRPTVLCSADRNLCIDAVAQGVDALGVMNPHDYKNPPWSSRVLGAYLRYDETKFQPWRPSYTEESVVVVCSEDNMDMDMDVDTIESHGLELYQNDARILLHNQVIEIFVALLRELVASDQRDLQRRAREGAAASVHAPSISRSIRASKRDTKVSDLTLEDILDYVVHPPYRALMLQKGNPSLNSFLSKPYQAYTGWRKGNDWSRQDWLISLRKLKEIGEAWGKRGEDIVDVLEFDLLPHVQAVFCDDDIRI